MNIPQRILLGLTLVAAQTLVGYCSQAKAEGVIATSRDSFGTELQLTDIQVGDCMAARGISPTGDRVTPACWTDNNGMIHVSYLLPLGVVWDDDIPSSEFIMTTYGREAQNEVR